MTDHKLEVKTWTKVSYHRTYFSM